MSRAPRVSSALLGVLLLGALLSAPGSEGRPDREGALAQIRRDIGALESRLTEARRREATLQDAVARVELELELQQMELEEATAALDLANERVATLEAEVEGLEEALAGVEADLRRRVVGLYGLGRHGYLRLFLSLDPDSSLLPAIRQLRFLVRRDERVLDRYRRTQRELVSRRESLDREVADRSEWQEREQQRRDRLVILREEQERLLVRVTRERRALDEETDRLREKERKLTRLVSSLVGRSGEPLAGTPMAQFRGVLDWPVDGATVQREFGTRRDPRYRTEVPHHGLDLGVASGAEVRAVYEGRVIYADVFEGYGPMVVVHHPGRVFTLYAGLAEIGVRKNDVVSLGSVLGASRERLYFELRRENQPVDPRDWLR